MSVPAPDNILGLWSWTGLTSSRQKQWNPLARKTQKSAACVEAASQDHRNGRSQLNDPSRDGVGWKQIKLPAAEGRVVFLETPLDRTYQALARCTIG